MADHHHDHADGDIDWAARGAELELEGDVLAPYLHAAVEWLYNLTAASGRAVQRILDLGSGPGVATSVLAATFPQAEVVAVDAAPELLARAMERAARQGVADRVRILQADLATDLADAGEADLIWGAMMLHHIGDQAQALVRFGKALKPDGLLAIVETATPSRYLPAGFDLAPSGLEDRVATAFSDWFADMRSGLPGSAPGDADEDVASLFARAGLDPVAAQTFAVDLDPPLTGDAQRHALGMLHRLIPLLGDRLDADDQRALTFLLDPKSDAGAVRRAQIHIHVSRTVHVARLPLP